SHLALDGVACLVGVSDPGATKTIDIGALNRALMIGNRVVFGSVNANRRHYEGALNALGAAPRDRLQGLITARVSLDDWPKAFERRQYDIKNVIDFAAIDEGRAT